MKIDARKVGLIHVARRQLGLDEDDYRAILARLGRVESAKDLDAAGFTRVMEHLNGMGFRSTSRARNFGLRAGMASPGQIALMRKLWSDYTDGAGDDRGLGKWLDRTFHFAALRFVDADAAPKVITALRAMVTKKADAKTAAPA